MAPAISSAPVSSPAVVSASVVSGSVVSPSVVSAQAGKLVYVDNVKILLTALVILHHVLVTYSGAGGWYYLEKTTQTGALIPMTILVSVNQSFFMGFFFLLAGYFTQSSLQRKGTAKFLGDRMLRLGVPLLFYSFVFSPFLSYLVYYYAKGHQLTYLEYLGSYDNWIEFGVLWFVAALLVFTFGYITFRRMFKTPAIAVLPVPGPLRIVLFAAVIGLISFFIRIVFPVGWVLKPLGFQPGHFAQYISLFILGLAASKSNWFNGLSNRTGKILGRFALCLLLFFPVFYLIRVKLNMPIAWYSGGLHWQSLLYAVWEQVIGFSILTALLAKGKQSWDHTSQFRSLLSRSSFATYILHPLVVISLSLAVKDLAVDPALKVLIVGPLSILGSFLIGVSAIKIPLVNRII